MTTNIVMIAKGRADLTRQALHSIADNTTEYTLTLVDDDVFWSPWFFRNKNWTEMHVESGILGQLRNLGAYWSEKKFGRGEWLCFLDNDVAVFPGWLSKMIAGIYGNVRIVGGCQHPFHETNRMFASVHETDAVAGYSMFMSWETWDRFGPFDANAPGIGQSEDFALCQRVKAAGGIVGYVDPPVLSHCGITNSDGKPAVGADQFPRVPGLLYL